jgi:hypothetical protein
VLFTFLVMDNKRPSMCVLMLTLPKRDFEQVLIVRFGQRADDRHPEVLLRSARKCPDCGNLPAEVNVE